MSKKLLAFTLLFTSPFAFAHAGHSDNFFAAFAHPFSGIDHLLMMLCVGIFAGRAGGHARWQLPTAFLGAMLAGAMLGSAGHAPAGFEAGIAAGLIALGVLFVWRVALPRAVHLVIIAAFALLHGMAHGGELSGAMPSLSGMLAATALLHGAGILIAAKIPAENARVYRGVGAALSLLGGGLLIAV